MLHVHSICDDGRGGDVGQVEDEEREVVQADAHHRHLGRERVEIRRAAEVDGEPVAGGEAATCLPEEPVERAQRLDVGVDLQLREDRAIVLELCRVGGQRARPACEQPPYRPIADRAQRLDVGVDRSAA